MLEIVITKDGSHTLYVPELDEHYHSVNGAITESRHVFIDAGLRNCVKNDIRILEMGFGTGLNALLTLTVANDLGKSIHYTGIEKYPLQPEVINSLNYESIITAPGTGIFKLLHVAPWQEEVLINKGFILKKVQADIQEIDQKNEFDLVYLDLFAPGKQPELWTYEIFSRIFRAMRLHSVLTTYSSKGLVRRNLEAAGFRVEKLPGPPGKLEMTRAWKDEG